MATITRKHEAAAGETKAVVRKHHWLVRLAHWSTLPFLLGLFLSGLSIYWAAPILKHPADAYGNEDYLATIGLWIARHEPWRHSYGASGDWVSPSIPYSTTWVYDHFSLGTGILATALRLHWLLGYPFVLLGLLYIIGLIRGKGYKSLLPRRGDLKNAFQIQVYYIGLPFAKLFRRPWHHPEVTTKYNALQRLAYGSVTPAAILISLSGWAIHKPMQLWWLQGLFGGYDYARVWHFWLSWYFVAFAIPHILLVALDGVDTMRSMIVGWSDRRVHAEPK